MTAALIEQQSSTQSPLSTARPRRHAARTTLSYALVLTGWATSLSVSTLLPASEIRWLWLVMHLAMLVIGLGAAVMTEYSGMLWALGRGTLDDVRHTEKRLSLLAWFGYSGMLLSGMFLSPSIFDPATAAKMLAVLLVGINAVTSGHLMRTLNRLPQQIAFREIPTRVQCACLINAMISQLCWWSAVLIGTLNTAGRGA